MAVFYDGSGNKVVINESASSDATTPSVIDYDRIMKGIAHRGMSANAPENTLPAFKLAAKNGFRYVEADVMFTADNVPVLIHDTTINRTARNADGSELTETLNVADLTYEEISAYDYGIWFDSSFSGTVIPKLEDFLVLCKNLGLHPYIELKTGASFSEEQVQAVVDMVEAIGMKGNVSYISSTLSWLTYVKNYDPYARLGLVNSNVVTESACTNCASLKTGTNEVFLDSFDIGADGIAYCMAQDIPLEIWTRDTRAQIINMNPYVTGITSNLLVAGKVIYEATIM